jgi:hypothetical protein
VVTVVVTIGVVVVEVDVEVVVVSKDELTVEATVALVDASVLEGGVVIAWELDVVAPSVVEVAFDKCSYHDRPFASLKCDFTLR